MYNYVVDQTFIVSSPLSIMDAKVSLVVKESMQQNNMQVLSTSLSGSNTIVYVKNYQPVNYNYVGTTMIGATSYTVVDAGWHMGNPSITISGDHTAEINPNDNLNYDYYETFINLDCFPNGFPSTVLALMSNSSISVAGNTLNWIMFDLSYGESPQTSMFKLSSQDHSKFQWDVVIVGASTNGLTAAIFVGLLHGFSFKNSFGNYYNPLKKTSMSGMLYYKNTVMGSSYESGVGTKVSINNTPVYSASSSIQWRLADGTYGEYNGTRDMSDQYVFVINDSYGDVTSFFPYGRVVAFPYGPLSSSVVYCDGNNSYVDLASYIVEYGIQETYLDGVKEPITLNPDVDAPINGSSLGDPAAITPSSITSSGVTLSWDRANDDMTADASLQYLVYRSLSANLTSLANIEANGTPIGTWASDLITLPVTSLSSATQYYFNLLVKDAAENKAAIYTMTNITTLSGSGSGGLTFTTLTPGSGNPTYYDASSTNLYRVSDSYIIEKLDGSNWVVQGDPNQPMPAYSGFAISPDGQTAYVYNNSGTELHKTTNGGTSWETIDISGLNIFQLGNGIVDGKIMCFAGGIDPVLRLYDGTNWMTPSGVITSTSGTFSLCGTASEMYALAGVSGGIYKSTDGGITFSLFASGQDIWPSQSVMLMGLVFSNGKPVVALYRYDGETNQGSNHLLEYNGSAWVEITSNLPSLFYMQVRNTSSSLFVLEDQTGTTGIYKADTSSSSTDTITGENANVTGTTTWGNGSSLTMTVDGHVGASGDLTLDITDLDQIVAVGSDKYINVEAGGSIRVKNRPKITVKVETKYRLRKRV